MRGVSAEKNILEVSLFLGLLLWPPHIACAQGNDNPTSGAAPLATEKVDLAAIGTLLHQLESEVQTLKVQVKDLKMQQETEQAESAGLRKELEETRSQLVALTTSPASAGGSPLAAGASTTQTVTEDPIARLEEGLQLADAKIAEQSQTKVESGSKYRVRLTGIVLFNTYGIRGYTNNTDFPQLALPADPLASAGSFSASVRQSQIGIQAFGPTIAGARTSADIQFDFAGGLPQTQNGATFGIMRLRTGIVRMDWTNTSLIGGQDSLFFAPLSPTSIATLAVPALAYSGNLWSWTPQVRVEHKFNLSDDSTFLVEGGILDNLTGEVPSSSFYRTPTAGESSGQPAYATRVAWTKKIQGQDFTIGAGGYYGRQLWGYNRSVDGWAGTVDFKAPLGKMFEFTSQFYRGRAVGGIGGGLGQSALWNEPLSNPATEVYGLDSIGGWAQLKYRATQKLQFNGAFGQENPFAADLRNFGANGTYFGQSLSRNQTALANFIYQPRSDFVFSLEYRHLKTFILDSNANTANVVNFSVGYIF